MEDKNPGQAPEQDRPQTPTTVTKAAAPAPHEGLPDERERKLIDDGQKRGDRDREELRKSGHGDH
jgi:hypothetical protein